VRHAFVPLFVIIENGYPHPRTLPIYGLICMNKRTTYEEEEEEEEE
tara:strand:+ start:1428 stop:1565 length:138 start_codon:yes stop_codon:yes gene_type:complete